MEERHVPLSTVAGRLGVSERTVRRWIQSGKLKATRPGRDYRIPESAVRALIEESEVSPKGPAPSPPEPSLLNGLEEERRILEYQRWADFVDRYADRWKRRLEAGNFDSGSLDEFYAFLEDVQPALLDLGLQEKREQPLGYGPTFGPTMSKAIMRLYHLFEPLMPALKEKFGDSELERARRRRTEQENTFGEGIRRGA